MTEGEGWGRVRRGKDSLPLHFDFIHHMVHRAWVPAQTALQSSFSLWVTEGESHTPTQDQKAFHFANGKWWRQLSKGVHCDSPIPNYVIISLIERLQRKYCAATTSLVVLSWIKGTFIHILSFTFTFFHANTSSELIRQITFFSKLNVWYPFLVKCFPRLNSVASFEW